MTSFDVRRILSDAADADLVSKAELCLQPEEWRALSEPERQAFCDAIATAWNIALPKDSPDDPASPETTAD